MSAEASVFQMGGGGFLYENYIQSAFLTTMILQGNIPTFQNSKIIEIGFQAKRKGYETDDLFLDIRKDEESYRVLIQIKFNIPLTKNSTIFKEVIQSFWKDFNNSDIFDRQKDKFFLIKSSLTNEDKNQIVTLLDWAKTHKDENDFFAEIERISIKKQYISLFSELLSEANQNEEVSQKQIWEFLKCFNLIAYDFTIKSSTNQSYFLDLIKLSKSKSIENTPVEIWNTILAKSAEYNKNGGTITYEDLKLFDFYKYFNLSLIEDAYSSLQKLTDEGNLIIKPLKNTIKNYHINRDDIRLNLNRSVADSPITFITGCPGVGKSAIVKELLENEFSDCIPLIFKADQFNKSTIAQVFGELQISHSLKELFSTISLLPKKLVIIDSAEKLLEGDPDNAFKQLLAILNDIKDLKLIITSRSYAVNIIIQKYGIDSSQANLIEIPNLSDLEIDNIVKEFPELNSFVINKDIKEILRSPKYLEYTVSVIEQRAFQTNDISLREFKEKLWSQIIENSTVVTKGLPRRREKAFIHIAVKRALTMQLFYEPDDDFNDFEAIDVLVNDDVISKNGLKYEFTPSHDILEDWALIKHIGIIQKKILKGESLFNKLDNQPALRRAFRLWIEDLIIDNPQQVINLINETLEGNIETYWTDEILTAVFRAKKCKVFFDTFKTTLLQNNATFLNRCILVARTTCREYSFDKNSKDILIPVGSVWEELLSFINTNYDEVSYVKPSIVGFLFDWEYKFIFQEEKCSLREIKGAIGISSNFIKEIENQDKYWLTSLEKENRKNIIYLFFSFLPENNTEVEELLIRYLEWEQKDTENREFNDFYEDIAEIAIGGIRNQKLVKYFPDLIIQIANLNWKPKPKPKKKPSKRKTIFDHSSYIDREDSWGVNKNHFEYSPPGVYKTFIYNLMIFHPLKGTMFVVDFINYMTSSYVKSEYGKKDSVKNIQLILNDNSIVEQNGNAYLWSAYRGTVVTNDLFESILIGFEKYLLEISSINKNKSHLLLQKLVDYSLKNTSSVAITSVIVSVFIAYPKAFGKTILPILKIREFYEFDLERGTREHTALAPMDFKISFAQKEKYESNHLPHRRKYIRGLRDFIFYYQFYIATLNKELQEIFDSFYENCNGDLFWEKAINEMDIRKYEPTILNKDKGVIQLEVSYSKEVKDKVQEFTDERKYENTSLNFSDILHNAVENKKDISIEKWNEIYTHFSSEKEQKSMFDRPVSLAVVGLTSFINELTQIQKEWCFNTISQTITEIIKEKFSRDYNIRGQVNYNLLEANLTIKSFHLLFENNEDAEILKELNIMLSYLLICHLADYERKEYFEYLRTVFNISQPEILLKQWQFLVSYSEFIKQKPDKFNRDQKIEEQFRENEYHFILDNISSNRIYDFESINFDSNSAYYLGLALLLIPVNTTNKEQQNYILNITKLILQDLKYEDELSFSYSSRAKRNRKLDSSLSIKIQFYFNEVLLYNDIEFSSKLLDILIDPFFKSDFKLIRSTSDVYNFVCEILNSAITRLDDIFVDENVDGIEKYKTQFWKLWKQLFEKVKSNNSNYFQKELLLDTKWPITSDNWKGFIEEEVLYKEILESFGEKNFQSVLNVLSTFGEKSFLPDALALVVKFLQNNPENTLYLNSKASKVLIKKLIINHISFIKNNQSLVSNFIYILNKMVEIGSSEAYLIRETVITYKKV